MYTTLSLFSLQARLQAIKESYAVEVSKKEGEVAELVPLPLPLTLTLNRCATARCEATLAW